MKRHRLNGTGRGRMEVLDTRWLLAGVADFNTDGLWDTQDLDALTMAISNGESDLKYDLDGDLTVNTDDMSSWRAIAATANGLVAPYKMGDANLDGRVDATDLNALAVNWLANTNRWSEGNFFLDGRVDALDLNALAKNWLGEIPTVSGTSAPLFPAPTLMATATSISLR